MLKQVTGIESVQKLYLQLLYRCNFNCLHCFQGVNLQRPECFSLEQINSLLNLFTGKYGTTCLTLLGGEPFVYKDLPKVLELAKHYGLETAICTNGYRITKPLRAIAHNLDTLRVSIEGNKESNDHIRRLNSFDEAIKTLVNAREMGVKTSVTTTVASSNVRQLANFARTLESVGVYELKLHELRLVGNAKNNGNLICNQDELNILVNQVSEIRHSTEVSVLLDDGLDSTCAIQEQGSPLPIQRELERVEVQPDGGMYVSCKAVGSDSNAFWFNKTTGEIEYHPTESDEIKQGVPQVQYLPLS